VILGFVAGTVGSVSFSDDINHRKICQL